MKFSSLTERLTSPIGDAWRVHNLACERRAAGDDIIMLSIGEETREQTSQGVVDAAISSLQAGRHHYSDVRGELQLREAVVDYHRRTSGVSSCADQCVVYYGAQNSLYAVSQCLLEQGDEVIVPEPYYTTYPATFTANGALAKSVLGDAQRYYLPSVAQIIHEVTAATRAIVITQPGNPMSAGYSADELQELVDHCNEQGLWLISDEVYSQMLEDEDRVCAASAKGSETCVITIGSLSKSHRMTGWRIGWVIGPAELAHHLAELSTCMHYGLPPFIMDAACAALADEGATARTIRQSMRDRRAVCNQMLSELPNIKLLDAGSGMFVILDLSDHALDASEFAERLLDETAVSILPCTGFGQVGRNLVRVGLCAPVEELHIACERIIRFAASLR